MKQFRDKFITWILNGNKIADFGAFCYKVRLVTSRVPVKSNRITRDRNMPLPFEFRSFLEMVPSLILDQKYVLRWQCKQLFLMAEK